MAIKPNLLMVSALVCISACLPAGAQTVYKCGARKSVTYTELPCSKRIVDTSEAAVPVKPNRSRIEQNRLPVRPKAGESAEQFEIRRRRARLTKEDRDECARIDVRMPVEEASMKNPDKLEVIKAELALAASRKRFSDLRC